MTRFKNDVHRKYFLLGDIVVKNPRFVPVISHLIMSENGLRDELFIACSLTNQYNANMISLSMSSADKQTEYEP